MPQPPYIVIAEELREKIDSGAFAPGDRMPSTAVLGRQHSVSPSVASRSYALLVEDGLVEARHGSGHYVALPRETEEFVRELTYDDGQHDEVVYGPGEKNRWRHESVPAAATSEVAERLELAEGDPVMRTDYVRYVGDRSVELRTSWEPLAVTGGSLIALPEAGPHAGLGVASRMREIGLTVTPVEEARARMATRREAQQLGIASGLPVMAVSRTYYDQSGRPVETADLVLLGEAWVSRYGARPKRP